MNSIDQTEFQSDIIKCMNCFQTAYAPILKKNDIDVSIMFLWGWSFKYVNEYEKLYEKPRNAYSRDTEQFLNTYTGLLISDIDYKVDGKEIVRTVDKETASDVDFVLGIDAFNCPWNKAFRKMHINHFVTVIGADVNSNTLKCIDWFSGKTDIYDLPCSEFDGVFYLKKVISNPHYEYKDAIKELTKAYDKDDFIKNYQSFIKDLKQVSDVEEVFENKNPELCRLLIILREFKQYREGIMHHFLAIDNNSRQNTIYGYLAEEFKNLYKQ